MNDIVKKGLFITFKMLIGVFVSVFLMVSFLAWVAKNKPMIFSLITTIIYLLLIYFTCWEYGKVDRNGYNKTAVSFKRILLISQIPSAIGYIIFVLTLLPSSNDFGLTLFKIWFNPYHSFYGDEVSVIESLVCVFSIPLWCIISYYLGSFKVSFMDIIIKKREENEQYKKEALERKKQERREMRKRLNK